jgi:hypothetical protein
LVCVNGTQSSRPPGTPPYGLSTPFFRFRALASLAGRAPLGGPREVALATYLVARLVDDCLPTRELPLDARAQRSSAARSWLSNVALPAPVRAPLTRLAEETGGETSDISAALASAISATSAYLDGAARLELDRLAHSFAK